MDITAAVLRSPLFDNPRFARGLLWVSLAVGFALRVQLGLTDHGIYWPDEIYQSLEPAHRMVFGYGMVAWEFIDGARNWTFPAFCAALLKLAAFFGLESPKAYLPWLRVWFATVATLTAWGTYRLAKTLGAGALFATLSAAFFSLAAPAIYFGHRAMSETASAAAVVWGLSFALQNSRRAVHIGAAILGFAVLLRLQCGVFCVGLLAVYLVQRRFADARDTAIVLATFGFIFGLIDYFSWRDLPNARLGGWFHSAVRYIEFNLIEGKASGWGTSPWFYFVKRLFTSMPLPFIASLMLLPFAAKKAPYALALSLGFIALHSLIPHKELRFILPALPILFAALSTGLSAIPQRFVLPAAGTTLVAFAISAATYRSLSFDQLGQYEDRPGQTAFDNPGMVNRLLLVASEREDLCGLRIDLVHMAWAGGHTYLHRQAPLYHHGTPSPETRYFNYLLTFEQPGMQNHIVARDEKEPRAVLVKLFDGPCRVDPHYTWRLP